MGSQNGLQAFCIKLKDGEQEWNDASRVDMSTTRAWVARQVAQKETGARESVD